MYKEGPGYLRTSRIDWYTTFDDLEWPLTQISRARYYSTLNLRNSTVRGHTRSSNVVPVDTTGTTAIQVPPCTKRNSPPNMKLVHWYTVAHPSVTILFHVAL